MRVRLLAWPVVLVLTPLAHAAITFSVTYPPEAYVGPFSGDVVVYISRYNPEPRYGPDWFKPEPVLVARFKDVKPGEPMVVSDANTRGKPNPTAILEPGEYHVQAVIDRNLGGRAAGDSPGNLYSASVKVALDPAKDVRVELECNRQVEEPEFKDTGRVKGVKLLSERLSAFHGRPTYLYAAVALPEEWVSEPSRRFPVVYEAPGFGGSHWGMSGVETPRGTRKNGVPFIVVSLNPDCPTGYSAFADSDNNGPWGKALIHELVPYIEKTYRGIGKPWARFITGHSSGGWTSLWLQIAYPDFFGGCWSISPDPVDFRAVQSVDIYKPGANAFLDEKGKTRPLARFGRSFVAITWQGFSDREWGLRGEQLGSFEAVFSPRGPDGEPARLWNRKTGAIDAKVAAAWRRYDIASILRKGWKTLGPKLKGKLFVLCGDEDTFYLDQAVRLLKKDLKALKSDATVELVPGDHGSVVTRELAARIDKAMAARYKAGAKKSK